MRDMTISLQHIAKLSILFWVVILLLSLPTQIGIAQEKKITAPEPKFSFEAQRDSITKTLVTEKENLGEIKRHLLEAQQLKKTLTNELNAYKLHLSTYGNLLLLPKIKIEELEKSMLDHRKSLENLDENLKGLRKKLETVTLLRSQTDEHFRLNEKHLLEIEEEKIKNPDAHILIASLKALISILASKRDLLQTINEVYTEQIGQLDEIYKSLSVLSRKYDQKIKERKKQDLFQRKDNLLVLLNLQQIGEEIQRIIQHFLLLGSKQFWSNFISVVWKFGGALLITFAFLLMISVYLLHRLQHFCLDCEQRSFFSQYPFRSFAFRLLQKSLLLFGTTLFLHTYSHVQLLFSTAPVIRAIINIFWTLSISQWFIDFIDHWKLKQVGAEPLVPRLRFLVGLVRWFTIPYLIIDWLLGSTSVFLLLARIGFGLALLTWHFHFLNQCREFIKPNRSTAASASFFLNMLVTTPGYLIAGGALLLDLTGFASFSVYWFSSWGRTAAVLLWGSIFFFILREWLLSLNVAAPNETEDSPSTNGHPFRWVLIWICWLAWLGILLVSIILAWGGRQTVIVGFFKTLNTPIAVGNMRFSVLGFVYATLILLFTHAAVRIWRHIFHDKMLSHSGFEVGLQDSIATITVYILWAFGILVALHTFGLNTTSLVVAFGALGIGLGFGLQNIFNNFISGIILLFERPIQVGDTVEINGIWATVKKINVRSTVVQTWDNASLIIPNSEFISTQVTNWSFRDMRLRRNITVGVAYGSDVELVKKTLLEIAEKMPRVLKYPNPDALFTDFGDSALIFKLRVWTVVEQMLPLESAIRFEIDRLFRERNITIAFPQRDIHIKSITGSIPSEAKSEDRSHKETRTVSPEFNNDTT